MKSISLDITKAAQFLSEGAVKAYEPQVVAAHEALENGTCPGNDFLGWLHLPSSITPEFIAELQSVANTLREKCEVVVVAGIGGSYLAHAPSLRLLATRSHGLLATRRTLQWCSPATTSARIILLNSPLILRTRNLVLSTSQSRAQLPRPLSPSVCSRSSVRTSAARRRLRT